MLPNGATAAADPANEDIQTMRYRGDQMVSADVLISRGICRRPTPLEINVVPCL
jgi:hypothetical protein